MDVSSKHVIDAVAAKLKYYMEVKRREDGFDLSGPNKPQRAYPFLKTGPMLSSGKLQDRSLKHYFTPSMIKAQIANLQAVPPGSPREKSVKTRLNRSMRRSSNKSVAHDDTITRQQLNDELYSAQLEALQILQAETQQRLRRKVHQGVPTLHSTAPPTMSHREAVRLVNRSSQILVATETVALAHDIISQRHGMHNTRPQSAPATRSEGLPGLFDDRPRPRTARGRVNVRRPISSTPKRRRRKPKYVWDINGRKVPYTEYEETFEEDPSSYSVSSSSVDIEPQYRSHGGHRRYRRPMSAMQSSRGNPHGAAYRPYSAGVIQHSDNVDVAPRKAVSPDSGFSIDAGTQTRLHRRPPDRTKHAFVVASSDDGRSTPVQLCKYRVEIETGDRLGASTTADVYLSLCGDLCETDEIYLTKPISQEKKRKPFKRGQVDVFEIETEKVGNLSKIGIGHDQKEKGYSWFVDSITVQCGGESWKFLCKTWFSGTFSRRQTFRYISLDHSPSESSASESSASDSTSDHTSSESSEVSSVDRRKKKTRHHKKSTSSNTSRSSLTSETSSASEMSRSSVKSVKNGKAREEASLDIKGQSYPSIKITKAESDKSTLEYSSDSSAGGKRRGKNDESFVEESDDTVTVAQSSSSDSESSNTSNESVKLAPGRTSAADSSGASTPKAANSENKIRKGLFDSSTDSSSESEVEVEKSSSFLQDARNLFSQATSSSSSESSSSDDEAIRDIPPTSVKKRLSLADSITIKIDSASEVASPTLVTASLETVEEPVKEEIEITNHEIMMTPSADSSRKSSSSSSSSSSEESDAKPESEIKRPRRLSFAESISVDLESANQISAPPIYSAATEKIEPIEEESEVNEQPIMTSPLDGSNSSRTSSTSSSSSNDSGDHDKDGRDEAAKDPMIKSTEEIAEEKADVFMEGFNAGIAATRKISLATPGLLEEPALKQDSFTPDDFQSDEEGMIQSPRQPVIRGDIHNLIKEGDMTKVADIISLRPELKEKTNEKGWTPVHVAATNGKLDILQWLAAMGADLNVETPTGYTALHMAAMHGHVQCVMVLHAMGANLDAVNIDGQTCLHLACMSGHLETTKWLVANRANIKARDNFNRTALDLARQYQHKEVAQFLKACVHDLKKQSSSISLLQTSKTSMESSIYSSHSSSNSSSSSSSEESVVEAASASWHDDPEAPDQDAVAELASHDQLEERRKIYDKQQKKMVKRRTSFLDMIRSETEDGSLSKNSSDAQSSSSSSSDSDHGKSD